MAWVPDSTSAGYLGPEASPQPVFDDDWDDFLHDVIAGVSGIDPTFVRPKWQPEPPDLPDFRNNWIAFGVTNIRTDFEPWVAHDYTGDGELGHDLLYENEINTVLCSIYGPNADRTFAYLRRGLYIEQNRALLRANSVGLVELTEPVRAPELIKQQWVNRFDTNVIFRRAINFVYAVRSLVQAKGTIYANDPLTTRVVEAPIDTGIVPSPTTWDANTTTWDSGTTLWDVP